MNPVLQILVMRDNLSIAEAREAMADCAAMILADPDDADKIILEELGLEPDYLFDII